MTERPPGETPPISEPDAQPTPPADRADGQRRTATETQPLPRLDDERDADETADAASPAPALPPDVGQAELARIYALRTLRWEREGSESLETRRARLLDVLAQSLPKIDRSVRRAATTPDGTVENGSAARWIFGGQWILLDDVQDIRPDLHDMIWQAVHQEMVEVGVWYVFVDESLVSGESLVRNLLLALEKVNQQGMALPTVAYMPGWMAHTPQLPQILRGFGVTAAFLNHGAPIVHLPFRWEAPDGSSILVISHDPRETLAQSLTNQKYVKPDGPFLWLTPAESGGNLPELTPYPVVNAHLRAYVDALRAEMPDALRPTLKGEMRFQTSRPHHYLLPGVYSARLYLKQANARLQNYLTHVVEPLLALAMTHGEPEHPQNLQAMLRYSWRRLLRNQARPALAGTGTDDVHTINEIRYRQVEDSAQAIIARALDALPGVPHAPADLPHRQQTLYAVVWNAHNWHIRQMVTLRLDLAPERYPARVIASSGRSLPFLWDNDTREISFIADVPPVGYSTYSIEPSATPPGAQHTLQSYNATQISDSSGASLLIEYNRLTWRHFASGTQIADLLRYIDGGDAGDAYNYSPPQEDLVEQAQLVGAVRVEECALFRRLVMRHRLRVAPGLNAHRNRERGLRLLDFTTTATFYTDIPGVYFRTTFHNTAHDHRLRVHLRTGIRTDRLLSDAPFGIVERKLSVDGSRLAPEDSTEGVSATYPMQTVSAVEDADGALALVARGLTEIEGIAEMGQVTLALTLVRAVGWVNRADVRTRRALVDRAVPAPDAQCLRPIDAEYALIPLPVNERSALLRAGQAFNAPLRAYQYSVPPEVAQRSYLSVTSGDANTQIILTALKPPERGAGWIVRLLNPEDIPLTAHISAHSRITHAERLRLDETEPQPVMPDEDGNLRLNVLPSEIVTLRLRFD